MTKNMEIRKIHYKLTFLFTGIAGLILIVMSVSYLLFSEKELKGNRYLSFLGESNTIIYNIAQQKNISHDWLTNVLAGNNFLLALYDHETPLNYTGTHLSEEEQELTKGVFSWVLENQLLGESSYENAVVCADFSYQAGDHTIYYANVARFGRNSSPFYAVILYSTEPLKEQLMYQRIRFLAVNVIGIFFLFLFSYFYTGRLLAPITENQRKQNAFLAAASHELRTPLAVILSCLSAAKTAEAEKKKDFLEIIEQQGIHMSNLVTDMLTLTGADNHTLTFQMSEIELDTLLLNIYEAFLPQASSNHLSLSVSLPEDKIPACVCDGERITQVLSILISNAICYGKDGGKIELSLIKPESCFLFVVTDHGVGISDQAKPHIFERFYREDASRFGKDHFGLGLSIAKEIIDAHRGNILVSDTPGGGTTFTVKLKQ